MTPSLPMAPRRAAGMWLALAAAAMPWSAARSEANPYYAGVSVGIGHISNITLSKDGDTHYPDVYASYGLVGGFDQPIGRQRLYASGSVTANKFADFSKYDNTSYNVNAGLDWATVERLSGSINAGLQQRLEYTGALNTQQTVERNIARTSQFSARVQYGLVELLSLEGAYAHREARYSAKAYENSRLNQDAVSVGIRRRLGGQLDIGAALRLTRGSYPVYDFDRRDLDLTANWAVTGASTLNARLSFGKQDNASKVVDPLTNLIIPVGDFSGVTGQVQWIYLPTGKLRFVTTLRRDGGYDLADPAAEGASVAAPVQYTRLTTTVGLAAAYEVTSKIRLNASLSQARRTFSDGSNGRDTTTLTSLGASYAPTRNWLLACEVGRQSRSADPAVSYAFGNTSGACSAQYVVK